MVFILPFVVVSCNENTTNQVKKETDLKQIIQSNNAYSSIKWISLEELEIKMKKVTTQGDFTFHQKRLSLL